MSVHLSLSRLRERRRFRSRSRDRDLSFFLVGDLDLDLSRLVTVLDGESERPVICSSDIHTFSDRIQNMRLENKYDNSSQ